MPRLVLLRLCRNWKFHGVGIIILRRRRRRLVLMMMMMMPTDDNETDADDGKNNTITNTATAITFTTNCRAMHSNGYFSSSSLVCFCGSCTWPSSRECGGITVGATIYQLWILGYVPTWTIIIKFVPMLRYTRQIQPRRQRRHRRRGHSRSSRMHRPVLPMYSCPRIVVQQ